MRYTAIGLFLLIMGCCLRPAGGQGMLDPLAKPGTRLGAGFLLALSVSVRGVDEGELCGQFLLDTEGKLQLTIGKEPLPKLPLKGLTTAQAREQILQAIRGYFRAEPEVIVGIARIPRMRVLVEGATFRNGPLTLPEGARLSDALAQTGFQANADLGQVQINRIEKDGSRIRLTANFRAVLEGGSSDEFNDPLLHNNDRITLTLTPTIPVPRTIMVMGEVRKPGVQPFVAEMKVRDALSAAQGFTDNADPERVTIRRLSAEKPLVVNAKLAAQNVATENLTLQPDDTIVVMPKDTGQRFAVVGAVASPTTFEYRQPMKLSEAIVAAGGFRPSADRRNLVLIRNMLRDPARAETVIINYDEIASGKAQDIPLMPGDMVQVMEKKKTRNPLTDIGLFILRMLLPF